ncbi:hypothetical protein CDD83_6707 [Cordyceps sp. RAO-2017]|nr:hypothetical protein CDD83_6707 [Cordyceps sp. RAO-2017]
MPRPALTQLAARRPSSECGSQGRTPPASRTGTWRARAMTAVWTAVLTARPMARPNWPTALMRAPPMAWSSRGRACEVKRVSEGQVVSAPMTDSIMAGKPTAK